MDLNNETLRDILVNIFKVDKENVVQRIGIWFNPQATDYKTKTWVAYNIESNTPFGLPYFEKKEIATVWKNYTMAPKIANISLQFVGTQSEQLANSIVFWQKRTDVMTELSKVNGKLMSDEMSVMAVPFYQDGINDIMSFNVTIRIAWIQELLTTQEILETVFIEGGIIYGN